jgi:succinate-semialdehyde dehydrogenase / glutarate-semialdehyde dehydrogenase
MSHPAYPPIGLFIDGRWEVDHEGSFEVRNPSDESVLARVPAADAATLDRALAAAQKGFEVWRDTAPEERARLLTRAVALVRERLETLAQIITLELGKPIADSRFEVARTCTIMEWDIGEGLRSYGRINPSGPGMQQLVMRLPIGPVAAFTPWNAPLGSPSRKISGALAAGCSIVVKGAEETPGALCAYAQCFADAGLPAGVLNLVFGKPSDISEYLIPQPAVRLVTFTGSVPVGKHLTALAGAHMKPVIMELGGHSPVIICDDVDPATSGATSAMAKSRNAGQVCVSPTRFFVEDAIFDKFTAAITEKAASLKIGNGLDTANQMGPLANDRRIAAMETLVADAKGRGARVMTGGSRIGNRGNFYPLTVLADVPDDARAMREEPFGPLALVNRVRSIDEAIEKANSVPYGLAGYAFTNSARKADLLAETIEVGNLSINHFVASSAETPFGGVKDSGFGREGGTEGLQGYTVVKNVSHQTV